MNIRKEIEYNFLFTFYFFYFSIQGKEFHNNEEKDKLFLNTLPFQVNAKP